MAKRFSECVGKEKERFTDTYLSCWDTINDTIKYHDNELAGFGIDTVKRLRLERDRRRWIAERNLLEARRQAIRRDELAIRPPSNTVVEKAGKLATKSDELLNQQDAVSELVLLATDAVRLFNSIHEA
jgi:hypothetical protein